MRPRRRVAALSVSTCAEAMNGNLGDRRRSCSMTIRFAKWEHILSRIRPSGLEKSSFLNPLYDSFSFGSQGPAPWLTNGSQQISVTSAEKPKYHRASSQSIFGVGRNARRPAPQQPNFEQNFNSFGWHRPGTQDVFPANHT